MPACPTSNDFDLLKFAELFLRNVDFVQKNTTAFLPNATNQRIFDSARLFKDFFEHEMLVAALFCHDRVP